MSDIKFSCPACGQHIACDAQCGGMQIKCPDCQNDVIIPEVEAQAAPQPAQRSPGPLRVTVPSSPIAPPPPAVSPIPQFTNAGRTPDMSPAKASGRGNTAGKIIRWAAVVIIVPIVIYYAFAWATSAQKKMNIARERERENSGGGQVGHIAELNSVLNATDPDKISSGRYDSGPSRATPILQPENTKLIPPEWTLDLAAARIPSGRANGSISGGAFVADRAYLEKIASGYVLTIRQGQGFQADREVIIYLTLKAGEKLAEKSWANSKDQTNGVSRIVKRWLAAGKQQTKSYPAGYTMKVEFGQTSGSSLPARLFIALPDDEKTVIGGSVEASFLLAGSVQPRPMRPAYRDNGDF